jgi:hypothetical protein
MMMQMDRLDKFFCLFKQKRVHPFICFLSVLSFFPLSDAYAEADSSKFMIRGQMVIDLEFGVEWLRCSIGQRWNGENCVGKILQISIETADQAITQANDQLGPGWRLPTKEELSALVCEICPGLKINEEIFPDTFGGPYWTSDTNRFARRHQWTVNFFTGHSYGRFFPTQEMAVRLVRDRI